MNSHFEPSPDVKGGGEGDGEFRKGGENIDFV